MTLWIHAPVECYHRPQCHSFFASTMKTSFVAALLLPFLLGAPAWAAEQTMIRTILVTVGDGPTVTASLAENASAQALARALSKGDITYEADDYGGFEKVGDIGRSLPRNDEPITSRPGTSFCMRAAGCVSSSVPIPGTTPASGVWKDWTGTLSGGCSARGRDGCG